MTNRVRLLRSLTAGVQPGAGTASDYGRLAVNLMDRRIWMYGATGTPALVASFVGDHQTTRAYRVGDLVVQGRAIYRCIVNHNPKGFTPTDWETVADDRDTLLYRAPTLQTQATMTMGAAGVSARVVAHPSQSAALQQWQVGSAVVSDIRADGYPGGAFGRVVFRVDQVAHSFSAVGQPARFDGSNWVLAEANTPAGFATGIIRRIINANAIEVQVSGRIDGMEAGAFESGAYVANTLYYVSVATPGKLTSVPPPNVAEQNVVLRTLSGGSAVIQFQLPASGGGGTSYDLNLTQNPNPFTAVGQVAAYDGTRWVLADPATSTEVPLALVKATAGFDVLLGFGGEITGITAGAATAFPLVPGTAYYSTAAGLLTTTPPTSSALGAGPVLWATGTNKGIILAGQASPNTLRASANLSDLADIPTALVNLGLTDVVRTSRTITAGAGLTGGGDLAANRTLALDAASIASLAKAYTAVQPTRQVASGTGLIGGGDLSADRTLALTGQARALHTFGGTGIIVRTGTDTFVGRSIAAGDGISVANGSAVAGNPSVAVDATVARTARLINTGTGLTGGGNLGADRTLALTGQALAFHHLVANGFAVRTGVDAAAARTITGTVNQIAVTNGDGVLGNPTISAVVASQGEAEAGTDTTKLMTPQRVAQAIAALGGPVDYQVFTSSGTWTKPANCRMVYVELWGGGGGGETNSSVAGGGGGGGFISRVLRASDLGATVTVTVGAGGAGGVPLSRSPGSDGGSSAFGSIIAQGGKGSPSWSSLFGRDAGDGGDGSKGASTTGIRAAGSISGGGGLGSSDPRIRPGANCTYGGGGGGGGGAQAGAGGVSAYGGNGGSGSTSLDNAAASGSAPGGGGGGSRGGGGGAGARGEVRVWAW